MLNMLWALMIITGVLYATVTGNMQAVSNGALDAAKEAVTLCITMLGAMSFWTGLMEISDVSGLTKRLAHGIQPCMKCLFPGIPEEHPAMQCMTTNMIANFLGLGWAATPAGIAAMKELAKLNTKERQQQGMASRHMCAFVVLNISSIQLIPITMIAYRSQYGSANPTLILAPAILATAISTATAAVFCMLQKERV